MKTSMSTLSYLIKNYNNVPLLKKLEEYDAIKYDYDDDKFIEVIIYEHKNKHLDAYIGNFIVESYKKEDPSEQSIWNSDTSRLTYLIKFILENNEIDWQVDKKGVKTNECIIVPVLDHINDCLSTYLLKPSVDFCMNSSHRELTEYKNNVNYIMEIRKSIETQTLNNNILKYIAPHFYLNKAIE